MHRCSFLLLAVLISQVCSAPQLISFKDGKLGVNFGGYHAGVGLGGLFGNNGQAGGLFAEAGTPYGQSAKAGLGGAVDANGKSAGGLYAGASAGGNVRASAGLAGGVAEDRSAGAGYASAQAGDRFASSGLGGEASGDKASGFKYSGSKSVQFTSGTVKDDELNVQPLAANEIKPVDTIEDNSQPPVIVKEIRHKPSHHHLHKKVIHGYVGANFDAPKVAVAPVYTNFQPAIQKRIDVASEVADRVAGPEIPTQVVHTKQVTFQRNPNFFADIFNIPISTLKAVGNFLGGAASGTNVSVQKTASVHTDSSLKYAPSSSTSEGHVSVETPAASKLIDDILAIPINTLGAVNKFLENNVPARKTVQVAQDGEGEPTQVRLGRARRRGHKKVVILQDTTETINTDKPQ